MAKKMTIRIRSILVMLLMLVTLSAWADLTSGNWTYTVSNNEATITGYIGTGTAINLPKALGGYTVTSIGQTAFEGDTTIVYINDGHSLIKNIGFAAFYGCTNLSEVKFPAVTNIGIGAFDGCKSLKTLTISSVTNIGDLAFEYCTSLKTVELPNVTEVGGQAFMSCSSLTTVTAPNLVSIGGKAFWWCGNLTKCIIKNNATIDTNDQYRDLFYGDMPNAVAILQDDSGLQYSVDTSNKTAALYSYVGSSTSVNVLSSVTLDGTAYSVTSVPYRAMYNKTDVTEVVLPETVTSIGEEAFYKDTSLKNITLPSSLESIGDDAFYKDTSLENITLPSNSNLESIGEYAFYNTSLENITLPSKLKSIGHCAFAYTNLTSVSIPASVTNIGNFAFSSCTQLTTIIVDEGNSYYKSVDGVLYDAELKTIVEYPAAKVATTFSIPESVIYVAVYAFHNCVNLESITIPGNVVSVGYAAFGDCSSLKEVVFKGEIAPELANKSVLNDLPSGAVVTVPAAAKTSYASADAWKEYTGTLAYDSEYTRNTKADKFGTICLPYAYTPTNATLYSVKEIAEDHVSLEEVTDNQGLANTPYIYQATKDSPSFNCTDTSNISEETTTAPTNGALTGSLYDGSTTAPGGSYVLQTQEGEQAFYPVAAGGTISVKPHRAYLNASENASALRIAFNDEETSATTGVEALRALTGDNPAIYDLNGRRLKTLQKGVNIVNGVKVYVK